MKRIVFVGIASLALASSAMADPLELTDAQMDKVSAGLLDNFSVLNNFSVLEGSSVLDGASLNIANVVPVAVSANTAAPTAVGVFSRLPVSANATTNGFSSNTVGIGQ